MSVRPSIARADGGITVTAPLPCPAAEARCLAVVCAVWARDAIGGDAKILWPNHVVEGDRRVCSVACRATADGDIMFTFRPSPEVDGDRFAQAVAAAAATALAVS